MTQTARVWKFKFPHYVSEYSTYVPGVPHGLTYTATKKYFFITYWLIYFIHGERKLKDLSARNYFEQEMAGREGEG